MVLTFAFHAGSGSGYHPFGRRERLEARIPGGIGGPPSAGRTLLAPGERKEREPMALLLAESWVENVEAFVQLHRELDGLRRQNGCTGARTLQLVDDAGTILMLLEFPTAEAGRAFLAAAIEEGGLERAFVSGVPRFEVYEDLPAGC